MRGVVATASERQRHLAAGHSEVDVRKYFRIEQGAVQIAMGIVDIVAPAQGVEVVLLARMHAASQCQRIEHAAQVGYP